MGEAAPRVDLLGGRGQRIQIVLTLHAWSISNRIPQNNTNVKHRYFALNFLISMILLFYFIARTPIQY